MRRICPAVLIALVFMPRLGLAQGDPIGPEFRVNTYTMGYQLGASVAADSSGRFVVVWSASDAYGGNVFGQRYDASGVPLGPEFRVNSYTLNSQYGPAVASDPSGNFVVAWVSSGQDGSFGGVFAQRFDSSGAAIGPEFRVNSYTTKTQTLPSVAMAGSGGFVVVWTGADEDGSSYGVFGQRFASSGTPSGAEFRVNTTVDFAQVRGEVAADPAGNFIVVWASYYQGSPAGPVIWGQRYASTGAPLGVEFQVSEGRFNAIDVLPAIEMTPAGEFVVVWNTCCGTGLSEVFARRFAFSGEPLGTAFQVNTYSTRDQAVADVAADALGNFVVTWASAQDGSGIDVFGQRYDGSGVPLGPEFRVNTYTTDAQTVPNVAADSIGRFVVVWQSALQDGSFGGIYGQRYSPIFPAELTTFTVH